MLESDYSTKIKELLETLPCEIRLPEQWTDYFSREGMLPAIENEHRQMPRKYLRTAAVLEIKTSLPAIVREPGVHAVYTRDVSRNSISFLNAEQLFPGEVCRLWLTDRRFTVDVVRCTRVNSSCYIVGGMLA